jgi:pyridoxine/pyridoxamine 5'-phosphate oxidase
MKTKSFEEFLREWHMKDYRGADDDAPDAFDSWLDDLDQNTLMELADVAIVEAQMEGMERSRKIIMDAFNSPIK